MKLAHKQIKHLIDVFWPRAAAAVHVAIEHVVEWIGLGIVIHFL